MNQHWETAQRFNKDFEAGQYDYMDKGLQQFQKDIKQTLKHWASIPEISLFGCHIQEHISIFSKGKRFIHRHIVN